MYQSISSPRDSFGCVICNFCGGSFDRENIAEWHTQHDTTIAITCCTECARTILPNFMADALLTKKILVHAEDVPKSCERAIEGAMVAFWQALVAHVKTKWGQKW